MPWVPPLVAAALGVATGWLTPTLLRWLPEPVDDPDVTTKLPYAALATPRFSRGVAVATLLASWVAFSGAPSRAWLAWVSLSVVGVISAAIDLRTTWLPLPLARAGWLVAATGVVLASAVGGDPLVLLWAGAGALGLWAVFELMWRLTGGIGYGDVRLMATVGAVAGAHDPRLVLPSALAGTVIGAVWGIAHRLLRGPGHFPYGPALLAGPFVALVWWNLTR